MMFFGFIMSCEIDDDNYSVIPDIAFLKSSHRYRIDTDGYSMDIVTIEFNMIDGDGDVGLFAYDTVSPFVGDSSNNFIYQMYVINDGEVKIDTILKENGFRIPHAEQYGLDEVLKAKVIIDFEMPWRSIYPEPIDSIYYSFYIMDRRFHVSNVEWSDTIIFK